MPLEKSSSKPAFVRNLKAEIAAGKPQNQALAIAYSVKRRAKRAKGGAVHIGPITGSTGGRADKVPMHVPEGSYVVPADVVSGLGEGNTDAGQRAIAKMFPSHRARGGAVPIMAAHGETIISPEQLKARFGDDLDHAHAIMDEWVKHERAQLIETLRKLPGPAKD